MAQRRRCEESGQPALEQSRSEERRLKPRAAAGCLRDLEQQFPVCVRVAERRDDAIVAVHLHCETQATRLPPERDVPWKQDKRQ